MRLTIRYLTTYTYGSEVGESQNALRVRPIDDEGQRVLSYQLETDPASSITSYTDYWGTHVDMFGINEPHRRLTIVADSVVETHPKPEPHAGASISPLGDGYEYLVQSPHVEWDPDIVAWARGLVEEASLPSEKALQVHEAVSSHLSYVPDSTEVGVSVREVLEAKRGVCQDYSHLAIAAYRILGMPARYVSGYFYATSDGAQPTEDAITVATHAWVEVAIPGYGWWGLDPTNRQVAGERHVKIGHGRDYEDVTPLRGVFHGAVEEAGLDVGVTMSRASLATYEVKAQPVYSQQQQEQ